MGLVLTVQSSAHNPKGGRCDYQRRLLLPSYSTHYSLLSSHYIHDEGIEGRQLPWHTNRRGHQIQISPVHYEYQSSQTCTRCFCTALHNGYIGMEYLIRGNISMLVCVYLIPQTITPYTPPLLSGIASFAVFARYHSRNTVETLFPHTKIKSEK